MLEKFKSELIELITKQTELLQKLEENDKYDSLELYSQMIQSDALLKDIILNIKDITEKREDTLKRINMYTLSAKVPDNIEEIEVEERGKTVKKRVYNPIVTKGQVIRVNFSGLGSELYKEHYAIVWDVKSNREQITVIPTYSYKSDTMEKNNLFNIGGVRNLYNLTNSETLVSIDQVTTISRKRILATDFEGKTAYLTADQKKRIMDGFRAYWVKEKTLYNIISETYKDHLPHFTDLNLSLNHMFRPILRKNWKKIDEDQKLLTYSFYDDKDNGNNPIEYEIKFIKMKVPNNKSRKNLIDSLIYHKANKDKTRNEVRTAAYNNIQSATKEVS
ncbi:type II toxin-antitoxin system PemK/MazF family toxin [Priestia megaterium]|uniref:type II toxin-antitoxin system PemK/MazF family toxin n=1 Tax=Priestia megaterium TaxID=1404 RepID=UPI00159C8761|nr:type II toxin-antitoxin system PemK/MazF family toxin [Priestia megaterium]